MKPIISFSCVSHNIKRTHHSGKKYDDEGNVRPQEPDHATCDFAKSAQIFKKVRDLVAKNATYVTMRKTWRNNE